MPRRYFPETMELDAITPASPATPPQVHHTEGHSDVSRPPQPSRLRRLSELIDPLTLGERSHVRSPSGQILGAAEFMAHPGRPLSIRERQEAIREKVRAATAKLAEETKRAEEEAAAAAASKKRKRLMAGSDFQAGIYSTAFGLSTTGIFTTPTRFNFFNSFQISDVISVFGHFDTTRVSSKLRPRLTHTPQIQSQSAVLNMPAVPVHGSGQEVGQNPLIKCTYPTCEKTFDCQKDMKRHKLSDPDHDYCKKCDVDCDSYDDLTQHKVSMMAEFWADKDRKPGDSPAHITCEFCGMDFKSFGGRKKHREQFHPADQSVYCPAKDDGCHLLFTRAAHMIAHLENGECSVIGAYEFRASIVHKHVVKQIMENPEEFAHNLQANKAFADRRRELDAIADSTESHKQGERQHENILDEESDDQKSGYKPLQPETDLMQAPYPSSRAQQETWPRLPRSAFSQMNESMKKMSIGSQAASSSGVETCTPFASPTSSATIDSSELEGTGACAKTRDSRAILKGVPAAWSTGKASQALFKDAKPTPPSTEVAKKHEEELASSKTNLMYSHFYDPESPEYDADFFLSPYTEKYECPFPGCGFEGGSSFDVPSELQEHLSWAHLRTDLSCTTCLKRFRSATALVAHRESTQRCRIKDSSNYHVLLDSISGGFLEATKVRQPSIINPERSVIRAGQQPANGVMTMKYSSKMPKRN
ncbi:hypothetical protein KC360_g6803 [Hortaea werneckii]|nr:hypothetical protein KC325_g6692 [Hortaea werneckii]KAI6989237.1 hypothetical protein KC359_g7309 [Hortaea werneckii]KAI7142979.1 hypothetical protein KC344_g6713 [Hortaea werneckii]KAI7170464.1 hypothetical protein KC360_g6803 [Hortaea werneckii]